MGFKNYIDNAKHHNIPFKKLSKMSQDYVKSLIGFKNYIYSVAKHHNIPFKKLSKMSQDLCKVFNRFQKLHL